MSNHSFDNQISPETYLCHGPFDPEVFGGVVNPPVYHASTVIFKNCKELNERHQALFEDAEDEVMYYGRFGTPITFAVQKALAELEGTDLYWCLLDLQPAQVRYWLWLKMAIISWSVVAFTARRVDSSIMCWPKWAFRQPFSIRLLAIALLNCSRKIRP